MNSRPQITFIRTPETREQNQIEKEALTLLVNKDYAALEALAAKHRASKERYASGIWKLGIVYNGLEPSGDASDAEWQARLDQIQDWIKASPKAITPRVASARIIASYAWRARGGATANEVKDASWQTFVARLQKGSAYLDGAKRLQEKCPLYWSTLQRTALGLQFDKQRYNAIFAQAIQEYPDYQYYYNARAFFLLPRWYGDEGEWERDLAQSCDRIGGEAGDAIYARVFWELSHQVAKDVVPVLTLNKATSERVEKGFVVILKKFPESQAAKAAHVYLAAIVGDKEKARNYLRETKGEVDAEFWSGEEGCRRFFNWVFSP